MCEDYCGVDADLGRGSHAQMFAEALRRFGELSKVLYGIEPQLDEQSAAVKDNEDLLRWCFAFTEQNPQMPLEARTHPLYVAVFHTIGRGEVPAMLKLTKTIGVMEPQLLLCGPREVLRRCQGLGGQWTPGLANHRSSALPPMPLELALQHAESWDLD